MCSFYILKPDPICNTDVFYFILVIISLTCSFFVQYPEFLKIFALLVFKQMIHLINTMVKQYSVRT